MSLLEVQGLSKRFGGVVAAQAVSFALARGEIAAVIGPNGAGKSTLFNMIGGQLAPDSGQVLFAGKTVTGRSPRAVWRMGLARTFQVAATFASMTVAENVQMALISRAGRLHDPLATASALYREEAHALLARVGLAAQAERACAVLAYGDVKRLELAIALASEPRLILMDEPTAGMAPGERAAMMTLVAGLAGERDVTVLFTEHDMDVVFGHARRVMVLDRGRLIAQGTPDEIRADEEVQQVYLGGEDAL